MLKIINLSKKFADFTAVNQVSLSIGSGEFFALIGPNGSGKTTIIKSILGLLKPSSGEILVDGQNIEEYPLPTKAKMAYIPDDPKIWSYITGEEFLYFSGALYGMPKEDVAKKIPALLSHFKLEGIEKKYFESYSRGNKQKFTILAALLHEPQLILVDEPIVGLDPQSAETAMELLNDFVKRGGSVLLTTHTLTVAEKYATKIGLLYNSNLVAFGSLNELRREIKNPQASLLDIYFNFISHD
jgi:ABC-2 type transport system ATP-binding protein